MNVSSPTWLRASLLTGAMASLLLLAPLPAHAAWPNDHVNPLNTGINWNTMGDVQMCSDRTGGFWVGDNYNPGLSSAFELRHISGTGVILASVPTESNSGYSLQIAGADASGGVYVVWRDSGTNSVRAAHYTSAGARTWAAGGIVVCNFITGAPPTDPAAVVSSNGDLIVGWTDARNGSNDIYMQSISPAGTPYLAANGMPVILLAGSSQDHVVMVPDASGGAVFVWLDNRNSATTGIDLYAQRMTYTGAAFWGFTYGAPVANAVGNAANPHIVSGTGIVLIAWDEDRGLGTGKDIYAQKLAVASGFPGMGSTGAVVCNAASDQVNPGIASDGLGGMIAAWEDSRNSATSGVDIYVQRVGAGGTSLWTTNGIRVAGSIDAQVDPQVVADDANGAIFVWTDSRSGMSDIYAAHYNASGLSIGAGGGVVICDADWFQASPAAIPDGAGGAFITFGGDPPDVYGNFTYNVYAQHFDRFSYIGTPQPAIAGVKDVANDQGGQVRVSWSGSFLDALPSNKITEYWVWREAPALAAPAAMAAMRNGRVLRAEQTAAGTTYWERIAVEPASGLAGYSVVAQTTSDSIGVSNPRTKFQVEAYQSSTGFYWLSAPDSGYSVDNIPPVTPSPQYATYSAGTVRLGWLPNHEADLAGYEVYRGTSADFTPSPATLVASQPDTGFVNVAGAPYYYKLLAVDAHGNRSPVATILPTGTLGVPSEAATLFFATPVPNPARGGTLLRFGLAREGFAKLAIYDTAGRLVRTVHSGALAAGEHAIRWDANGADGRDVAPGLYLARLETAGAAAMVQRVVVTR